MNPLPRLLETYAEGRMLLEAKGWPLAAAAEHLAEMPGLKRFHISQAKISKRTTPGSKFPIEPEVAAAIEEMETRIGYERQTEIVTAGLRAAHGDRGPAGRARLSAVQRVFRFLWKLAERFGRAAWKPIAIAGSGALVGCLALLVAPLLAGAAQPGPLMVMVFGPGADETPVRFDPRSLFDNMPAKWGEKPLDQPIPKFTLPGQKVAPCDTELGDVAINGNCWIRVADVKPPCGRLFRHEDSCYRPIAADPKKPIGPVP